MNRPGHIGERQIQDRGATKLVSICPLNTDEARIWENDEVRDESWLDSQKGGIPFLLDVMVAQGELIRR